MTRQCEAKCPIEPIPAITDPDVLAFERNPDRSDTERLTPRMKTALSCLQDAIKNTGGTSSVGSAYRPPAYNQYMINVWDKWKLELEREKRPECQALRSEVQAHFKDHDMVRRPHPNSAHTRGEAFDLTSDHSWLVLDTLAEGCGVWRNDPIHDHPHFIHR